MKIYNLQFTIYNFKIFLKGLFLVSCFLLLIPSPVYAGVYDNYVYQYSAPVNISGTADLQSKLESEVNKVIAAGHLAPFRALYGEGVGTTGQYYWYHNYDTVYTLSLAYPYVSSATQNAIKTYLTTEMATYPVWSATYLSPTTGTRRQPDQLTNTEIGVLSTAGGYTTRPKLFALYALWLYAQNTGDWAYIQNNWTNIKNFYTTYRTESANFYSSNAGAIGYARMARLKSPADSAAETQALADVNTGLTNGKNFTAFGSNAITAFQFTCGEIWSYCLSGFYQGFQFIDISPEIGKYIFDDNALKSAVLGSSPTDIFSLKRAEYQFPLWYISQGPFDTDYFGEGSGNPPDTRSMVFPLKAWVQKQPASQLRTYLDVPDALIGDYYYMQNMVRTIESSGTECWESILTTTLECSGTIIPSPTPSLPPPSPSLSPSPLPSPSPSPLPGDIIVNGRVDIFDYNALLSDFGKTSNFNPLADIVVNGRIDIFDYNSLLSNFGRTSP